MNWLMMTKNEIECSRPVCVLCDMMILDDSYQGVFTRGANGFIPYHIGCFDDALTKQMEKGNLNLRLNA